MQGLVSEWQVHSRGTQIQSGLLPIHLVAAILSLAQWTRLLGFGMQGLVSVWQVHSRGTHLQSCLLAIPLMATILSLHPLIFPLKCGGLRTLFFSMIYAPRIIGFYLLMMLCMVG